MQLHVNVTTKNKHNYWQAILCDSLRGYSHCAAVITAVLAREHAIAGRPLKMSSYVDCLGILQPDLDTSRPFQAAPMSVIFDYDPEIVSHVRQQDEMRMKVTQGIEIFIGHSTV